jgi:hypothetical protein
MVSYVVNESVKPITLSGNLYRLKDVNFGCFSSEEVIFPEELKDEEYEIKLYMAHYYFGNLRCFTTEEYTFFGDAKHAREQALVGYFGRGKTVIFMNFLKDTPIREYIKKLEEEQ